MHIIIIANHQPTALAPLTDNGSLAMLPIGGKPLIEHLLENVATVQHEKMTIVASRGFDTLRKFVGSGERWGLDTTLVSSRPNEPINSLQRRLPEIFSEDLIILSADRVYTSSLATHEDVATSSTSSSAGQPLVKKIMQPAHAVADHKDYLDLNLKAARGDVKIIRLRGRQRALGLTTGYRTNINPRSVRVGQTHTGNNCRVDSSAQLHGTVLLDSSVVIDRNTRLEDSIVLEQTYVGEQLNLNRCIVSGPHIIRVDEGVVVKMTDSFMAAPLQEGIFSAHLSGPANQLVGVIAGVVALPIMGAALLASLWESPYEPIVKKTWVSNLPVNSGQTYRTYETFEFNVSHQAIRRLPQVLDVSLGHLRWFGVSVATSDELDSRSEPWQMTRDQCLAGVFGPTQISGDASMSADERFLGDASYVPVAGWRTNVSLLKDAMRRLIPSAQTSENSAQI